MLETEPSAFMPPEADRSPFFDRREKYFEKYVTEVLGLPSNANDMEIAAAMEVELKERPDNMSTWGTQA